MNATEAIKAALRKLGAVTSGGTPTTAELNDGLEVLNDMIESWNGNHQLIFENTRETLTLTSGTSIYTIGTGAVAPNFNTARPQKLLTGVIRLNNVDYVVKLMEREEYAQVPVKDTKTWPQRMYYRKTYPFGTIYFDFEPDENYTFILTSIKPLPTFVDLTTEIVLPPEYERAIKLGLTVDLAPEYGGDISQALILSARRAFQNLVGQNFDSQPVRFDAMLTGGGQYNIYSDS